VRGETARRRGDWAAARTFSRFSILESGVPSQLLRAGRCAQDVTDLPDRRYDSDFRTLQSLVDQNVFGQITEAEIHYDVDFPPWASGNPGPDFKPGGGLMFGIGCHVLDQALALFGQPTSVTGFYRSLVHPSKSDNAFTIVLQYDPSGPQKDLLVTVKGSIVSNLVYPLKYFVRGFDGTFIKHGEDPQEPQIVSEGMASTDPKFGYEHPDTYGVLTTSKKAHDSQQEKKGKWVGNMPSLKGDYMGYYEDVAKAIRGEKELVVKPETSRDGIRVIELARESAELGRTLPFA
jgi:predicted dehydrogenase